MLLAKVVCAVRPSWADRYGPTITGAATTVDFVHDGVALTEALARNWSIDLVVLDLALATPALAARLGAVGPRLIAFGDPANAGIAFVANLVDFIDDNPSIADLSGAMEAAAVVPRTEVADLSDQTVSRLGALGAEAERITAALARLAVPRGISPTPPPVQLAEVHDLIRARHARDRFFPANIFADPAWDMLLDLTAAQIEGRDVSVSSLCIAARVPPTTALRWIKTLCDAGLFARTNDPNDARRAFIALAEPATTAMAGYLMALSQNR